MAALLREVGTYLDNFSVFQVGLLSLQLRTSLCLITEEGGHRLFGCILGSLDTNFLDLRFVGDGSSHLGSLFGVYVPKVGLGHSGGVSLRRGLPRPSQFIWLNSGLSLTVWKHTERTTQINQARVGGRALTNVLLTYLWPCPWRLWRGQPPPWPSPWSCAWLAWRLGRYRAASFQIS